MKETWSDTIKQMVKKAGKGKSFKCLMGFMCPDQYSLT